MEDQKKNIKFFFPNDLKAFSILLFITKALLIRDKSIKLEFNIFIASLFCSTKVTSLAPRDKASRPNDPIPEYKSRIFELLILIGIY